jgi:hypothetical protein
VRLTLGEGDDDRDIELHGVGPSWAARSRAVATVLAQWTADGEVA